MALKFDFTVGQLQLERSSHVVNINSNEYLQIFDDNNPRSCMFNVKMVVIKITYSTY
jgi:hypothetical protein